MILLSLLAAVIPASVLTWAIWWSDRYEREPLRLLVAAFTWGAIPAIVLALIFELILGAPFSEDLLSGQLAQTAMIAPIVEELIKGIALLGLMFFSRAEIDDVLDGMVYGALVGVGFAMTENFLYFLNANTGGDLILLVLLRSFVFGLNHILYTSIFGAAVGFAVQKRNKGVQIIVLTAGILLAIGAHTFHNFSMVMSNQFWPLFFMSFLLSWGGAFIMLVIVLASLQRERHIIQHYLDNDNLPQISAQDKKRLLSLIPYWSRWFPFLPGRNENRRLTAQLDQTIAEAAFHWQRLHDCSGEECEALRKEIANLQARQTKIQSLRHKLMVDASR